MQNIGASLHADGTKSEARLPMEPTEIDLDLDLDAPFLEPCRHPAWHRQGTLQKQETKGWVLFWIKKRLPFLQWIPHYSLRNDLCSDLIGGTTIGMVCLAQTLAHAAIATTSPIQGPYCAFVPALVYAFLGTSIHASVSSGAIAAIIIADQLRPWSDVHDRTQMASLLALFSGAALFSIGCLKLTFAMRFLSQPTISGFVTGGSILIVAQQLKNLCGFYSAGECTSVIEKMKERGVVNPVCEPFPHTDHFIDLVGALIHFMPKIEYPSLILGLVLMFLLDNMNKLKTRSKDAISQRKPWGFYLKRFTEMKEIIAVILSVAFCVLTLTPHGHPIVVTVGEIPAGLPPYHAPWDCEAARGLFRNEYPVNGPAGTVPWQSQAGLLSQFIFGGSLVAFTTFLTTFATAKKMALKNGYPLDPAQEMIGLGCAGMSGSFFGAFPPSGSLSRTGLADECGVKTQAGGIVCAGVIGLGLVYLAPALKFLPKTTLAAIVITSTKSLIDFSTPRKLLKFWRPISRGGMKRDLIVWILAFVFTIFLGVLQGIFISVVFSICLVVADAAAPDGVVLGKVDFLTGKEVGRKWRNVKDWPDAEQIPGIFIFEFRGPLSFASAEWFEERIEKKRYSYEQSSGSAVRFVILSLQSVHRLDSTALTVLEELLVTWRKAGIECLVSDAKHSVRFLIEEELCQRAKLLDQTAFNISIGDAVAIARRRMAIKHHDHNRAEEERELLVRKKTGSSPVPGTERRRFA